MANQCVLIIVLSFSNGSSCFRLVLTKLGYLIDNPWNNALDRARAAGSVLAQLLVQRHLGVRPITLIGFSLGARVIFYALLELAKAKAFGIVQDVFILGATLAASQSAWCSARSAVSGRFVNAYAKNDWVLNYLFRATSGGLSSVAGLRPIEDVPGVENVDVTDKIAGHMSYRTFMPLILDQLGFPVTADYFDEPVVRATRDVASLALVGMMTDGWHRNPILKEREWSFGRWKRKRRRKSKDGSPDAQRSHRFRPRLVRDLPALLRLVPLGGNPRRDHKKTTSHPARMPLQVPCLLQPPVRPPRLNGVHQTPQRMLLSTLDLIWLPSNT